MTHVLPSTHAAATYAQVGPLTDLSMYHAYLVHLPNSIADLCRIIQGLLVHVFWHGPEASPLTEEHRRALQTRSAAAKLAAILALDDRPLTIARPPERRLAATSRDYSLLLVALLRLQGLPARVRCGFATFFAPCCCEEHWMVEYWNDDDHRWVLVDPQMDNAQRHALSVSFDPLDVPRSRFLSSGAAWQHCRSGLLDPAIFGSLENRGMYAIRCALIHDLAALNCIEMLPWDRWGLMLPSEEMLSDADITLFDTIAYVTVGALATPSPESVAALFASDARLRPTVPFDSINEEALFDLSERT
ncbi:MAG: transglutaminase domain-containing protein [Roseiflexus sp.]